MARVIKASGAARATDLGAFSFEDLELKAQRYIEQMRGQAAQMLTQAQKDATAIRQRAEQEGKQAAMAAMEKTVDEKVAKQMVTLLPALKQAVASIVEARQAWLAHSERATVKLAAGIASRVIRRELAQSPQITLTLIQEALEMAAGSADIQLRLHPEDHAALAGQTRALIAELGRLGTAEIVADPAISRGGCRVETRFGSIDQQIEAQLDRIEQELT